MCIKNNKYHLSKNVNFLEPLNQNKQFLLFLVISLFIFSGCASTRDINFNNFSSNRNPYLEVKVSPEFKYVMKISEEIKRKFRNKESYGNIKVDRYFFVPNSITKGIILKYIYIELEELKSSGYFGEPHLNKYKSTYKLGLIKLGDYTFEERLDIIAPTPMDKSRKMLFENGFIVPYCIISKMYSRIVSQDIAETIYYIEDASCSDFDCEKWSNKDNLSNDQIKYIEEFEKRAISSFQIIVSD